MTHDTCECYKKLKYQEFCAQLENSQENEPIERIKENRTSILNQREKAVKLPGVIKIKDSNFEYPDARDSNLLHLFSEMAEIITGVQDYENNILSFWILDVFLEGLRTAQLSEMSHRNQKATLHWMAFVYNMLQGSGSKLTRRDLFLKIKLLLLSSSDEETDDDDTVEEKTHTSTSTQNVTGRNTEKIKWKVPFPPEWRDDTNWISSEAEEGEIKPRDVDEYLVVEPEQELHDMKIILEIIYRIYARLWYFFLLRTSLRSTPNVNIVDLPVKLNIPKQMLKYDSASQTRSEKSNRRTSVRASEDRTAERQIKKNEYILPLQAAQDMDSFLRQLFDLHSRESITSEKDRGKQEKKKK